jgi:hypothetical protein
MVISLELIHEIVPWFRQIMRLSPVRVLICLKYVLGHGPYVPLYASDVS